MPTLIHGTTRQRAENIIRNGPNPRYHEPGGVPVNDGFSMYVDGGPYVFDSPEVYARGKARQFPNEGGAVILAVEIPEEIVNAADPLLPIEGGVVQFVEGFGIEELLSVWSALPKEIRTL